MATTVSTDGTDSTVSTDGIVLGTHGILTVEFRTISTEIIGDGIILTTLSTEMDGIALAAVLEEEAFPTTTVLLHGVQDSVTTL
jgi:hypothetical protein